MSDRKHTTGTIAGHSFSLRMDASAPDELVADIEAALASVKAGGCTPNSHLRELVSEWKARDVFINEQSESASNKFKKGYAGGVATAADELEALIDDDTQDNE